MPYRGHRWWAIFALIALALFIFAPRWSFGSPGESIPKSALSTSSSRVKVSASWLQSLLIKEIKRAYRRDSARIDVYVKEPWEDVTLKRSPASYRVAGLSGIKSGRMARMRVELLGPRGRLMKGVWVSGVVSIKRAVWVATRDIDSGEVLKESDIAREERDERQVARGSTEDPAEVLGMTAKRSLVAGTVIREDQFKKRILVRRGQKVSILLSEGPIRVVAPGQVLEKGAAGELVQVLNISSSRKVTARVSDAGTVFVEY